MKNEGVQLPFPSLLTADIQGPSFCFLELRGHGLRRMEMSRVLRTKELWSWPFCQAAGSGVGRGWWAGCSKV